MNTQPTILPANLKVISAKAVEVLSTLREAVESTYRPGWGTVYLDNARPAGMSARSFAGFLSALETAGLYEKETGKDYAGFFGYVDRDTVVASKD